MNIIELTESHKDTIITLFYENQSTVIEKNSAGLLEHKVFSETYLANLSRYKAYGLEDGNGKMLGLISFYISSAEPVWYGTTIRSTNNKKYVRILLDAVIKYNEDCGRYRFYTLWPTKYSKFLRRFAFSDNTKERYDYFDECVVPAKTKCIYQNFWNILFNRMLVPVDTVVRCTYLKQECRKNIPIGGNL
jgi:hypothetical protein